MDLLGFKNKRVTDMSKLSTTVSNAFSRIESEYEQKKETALTDIKQAKLEIIDLFNDCSLNAVLDIDKLILNDEHDYKLPDTIRIGYLYPIEDNTHFRNACIPAILSFAKTNATAFLIDENNKEDLPNIFQLMAFRFMLSMPANSFKFHFVDTHSFGKKVSAIYKLSDKIIANAIVDDEKKLSELITGLEQGIREYSRNRLEIGTQETPYRFVFISNFPHGFSRELTERFLRLIKDQNATKAGVYIFYSIDSDVAAPYGFDITQYINISTFIRPVERDLYSIENNVFNKTFNNTFAVSLDVQFPENIEEIIKSINNKADNIKQPIISLDSYLENLIESNTYWKESSVLGFKVPIGKKAGNETVFFEFGGKTSDYFAMVGGRPGFGKTVLLHDIICNGSIMYSPQEINFYLIDCTNGTGFKPYDKLPHATFVSITNQREYTVSALEYLINDMYSRANAFKEAGENLRIAIEKIEEYRKRTGKILPRLIVIIDEFQVLLEKGDKISRKAGALLEKIIREGRKYGIHIIFCTQSYRGLDFNTDLITLRIAFNLKDYDSIKVLGGSNESAASLTQKGAAILNNQNGNPKENIRFQCAYTDKMVDRVSFCTSKLSELRDFHSNRFVFDGSINSDLFTNTEFIKLLSSKIKTGSKSPQMSKVYLGVPSFIRHEHIYFKIRRNPGSNLLIIGNDLASAMSSLILANYQLAKQSSSNSYFFIVDFLSADDERAGYYYDTCKIMNLTNVKYHKKSDIAELVNSIEQELDNRLDNDKQGIGNADKGRIVLTLSYIQNSKELKKDGYNVSPITKKLIKILKEGPDVGIHIMVYAYAYKSLLEVFEQNVLNDFENKVILAEGGGINALSEQTAPPQDKGYGLIQTDDETATYNPDPFVFYNRTGEGRISEKENKILHQIFSIHN